MRVLKLFEEICALPHGSGDTARMADFIEGFAIKAGYEVKRDEAGNLLANPVGFSGGDSKLCFQSHYDMVCVGEAAKKQALKLEYQTIESTNSPHPLPNPQKQTWLKAKDSSLGADNGMGVAIMLYFIEKSLDAEFLFTNDEEIGLLGAKDLGLPIKSGVLINLDSEVLGEVTIGCAGGYTYSFEGCFVTQALDEGLHYYSLEAKNFVGGHSGLDIHRKDRRAQNAVLESGLVLESMKAGDIKVIEWQGGEKRNSIPMHSAVKIASRAPLEDDFKALEFFSLKRLDPMDDAKGVDFKNLWNLLSDIKVGVLGSRDGAVIDSLNLSKLELNGGNLKLAFMGRSNEKTLLDANKENLKAALLKQREGLSMAKVDLEEDYSPWEKASVDSKGVLACMVASMQEGLSPLGLEAKVVELHAGLECGILLESLSRLGCNGIYALSIGPTICYPHSLKECVWVESVEVILKVLEAFIAKFNR